MIKIISRILLITTLFFSAQSSKAQAIYLNNSSTYNQNFDTLWYVQGADTNALPNGWFFAESGTNANTTYRVDSGASNSGNTYSYGQTGNLDRALGLLASGSLLPTVGSRFVNNTGGTITGLVVSYWGEQWRFGGPRTGTTRDTIYCQYSTNATALNNGTWTNRDSLHFLSPIITGTAGALNGNLGANRIYRMDTIPVTLTNGSEIWFRWTDPNIIGSDDGLAVDSFKLTPLLNAPTVQFSVVNQTQSESVSTFTVNVNITNPNSNATSVNVVAIGGSASGGGVDYSYSTQTVTFPASSSTSQSVTVTVVNDNTPEMDETIILELQNPTNGATIGTNNRDTLTIGNDDSPVLYFQTNSYSVSEATDTVRVTVKLKNPALSATTVDLVLSGGSATNTNDFTFTSPTSLTFFGATDTIKVIGIKINNDLLVEGNETIKLKLQNANNGATFSLDSTTISITDDDFIPQLSFTQVSQTVGENIGSVTARVRITNPTSVATTVNVILGASTNASNGSDFTFTSPTLLTFNIGDTVKTVSIPVNDDLIAESNENIVLRLSGASNNANYGNDSTTIIITDNDIPTLFFAQATQSVNESAGNLTVAVKYIFPAATNTSVNVILGVSGNATSGTDFTFTSPTQLVFTPTDTQKTILIPINDDILVEGAETFVLRLAAATNGAQFTTDSTIVTITDNDRIPQFSFTTARQTASENSGNAIVRVRMTNATSVNTTVEVNVTSGTATQGNDYNYTNTTLTFAPTDTVKTVSVAILEDAAIEGPENLLLSLQNASNNATYGISQDTIVINDNDYPRYNIGQINKVNANGVADSVNNRYEVTGIVYGGNLRAAGFQFTLRDNTGGIGIFSPSPTYGYTVTDGDSVKLSGRVSQFNGLTQLDFLDTVIVLATGKTLKTPSNVTQIDETTESDLVRVQYVTLIDTNTVWPINRNLYARIVGRTDSIQIRSLSIAGLAGVPIPKYFHVTGLGSQFDATIPYTSGYQLIPRRPSDIVPVTPEISLDTTTLTVNENGGQVKTKVRIKYPNGNASSVNIGYTGTAAIATDYSSGGASVSFPSTAMHNDSAEISVTLIDDNQNEPTETIITTLTPGTNTVVLSGQGVKTIQIIDNDQSSGIGTPDISGLNLYPNPANNRIVISANELIVSVKLVDLTGKAILYLEPWLNSVALDVQDLAAGSYFLQIQSVSGQAVKKVVIN